MYTLKKIQLLQHANLLAVERILYRSGQHMANKYNLHHWDNSHLKNLIILMLCARKNEIFGVYDKDSQLVATFQIRRQGTTFSFCKLATDPDFERRGIGSLCLEYIERMARDCKCSKVCLEVYDQSQHAIAFYKMRGYEICGTVSTRKYQELQMEKRMEY